MEGNFEGSKLNVIKLSKMPVRLAMDTNFLKLSPDDRIEKLIRELEQRTCAVVTDEAGKLLGFISVDEIISLLLPPSDYVLVGIDAMREAHFDWDRPVSEVMNPHPITLSPEDRLGYALEMMVETGVKQFPVVERGRVIGVFTARSLIHLLRVLMG